MKNTLKILSLTLFSILGVFSFNNIVYAVNISVTQPAGQNGDLYATYSNWTSGQWETFANEGTISTGGGGSALITNPQTRQVTITPNATSFRWFYVCSNSPSITIDCDGSPIISYKAEYINGILQTPNLEKSFFIEPYSPTNGTVSSSTSLTFTTPYYFNSLDFGVYDTVGFEIINLDTGNRGLFGTSTITTSGYATNTLSTSISASKNYMWRPIMYKESSPDTKIDGTWYTYTSTTSPLFTPYTPYTGAIVPTTSPEVTNLLSFLNVPYLLQTKMPFAYFFEARTIIQQSISSSTGQNMPSANITYKIGNQSTSTQEMFGSSTLHYFMSDNTINFLRQILVIILYAEFLYVMYHRAKNIKL